MKRYLSIMWLVMAFILVSCHNKKQSNDLNLSFEQHESGVPLKWIFHKNIRGYKTKIDCTVSREGKKSGLIECVSTNDCDFCTIVLMIPNYEGKRITLSGYIKTENVSDGYAGLWMRIDPKVGFDNMHDRGLVGTNDWTKCEITLDLKPSATQCIVIGGLLVGKGKMWMDDLQITIDGKDIQTLEPIAAGTDTEVIAEQAAPKSNISGIKLDKYTTKNLYDLGLIWGFLKYYHPSVAAGKYNWDYELFRILPRIVNERDMVKRDSIFRQWIEELGNFEIMEAEKSSESKIIIKPDLAWIDKSGFSNELALALNNVKMAKRENYNHYISMPYNKPKFTNENSFDKMKYPDMGYRLLALYRYWNIVEYYFPSKYIIGEDWKGVLKEFIPSFINAQDEMMYAHAVLEIICRINDTHAYLGNSRALYDAAGIWWPAAYVRFIENKAVVSGFYNQDLGKKSGLQIGDIITMVGGRKVEDIIRERLPRTSASNYVSKLNDIAQDLLRTTKDTIRLSFLRDGVEKQITVNNYHSGNMKMFDTRFSIPAKESFSIINDTISYLYPGLLRKGEIKMLWYRIKDTKALIVDLRCYPSDYISHTFCNMLLPYKTPCVIFTRGSITTPGQFTSSPAVEFGYYNKDYYKGKVVILVNETTISNAELTAMVFRQAPRSIVIGSTTAGADGDKTQIDLPGGLITFFSGLGVYTADGKQTQRVGIIPDIEVKPTIDGIKEGRDELMEKALEVINQKQIKSKFKSIFQ